MVEVWHRKYENENMRLVNKLWINRRSEFYYKATSKIEWEEVHDLEHQKKRFF